MSDKAPGPVVSCQEVVLSAIRRFQEGQKTGSLTLHFKDGRFMQVEERIVARV